MSGLCDRRWSARIGVLLFALVLVAAGPISRDLAESGPRVGAAGVGALTDVAEGARHAHPPKAAIGQHGHGDPAVAVTRGAVANVVRSTPVRSWELAFALLVVLLASEQATRTVRRPRRVGWSPRSAIGAPDPSRGPPAP